MRYRNAMMSKGKIVLQTAYFVLLSPLLLMIATIRVRTK